MWCPWWALGTPTTVMYLWLRKDLHGLKILSLLDVDCAAHLMRWSLVCQRSVSRSVKFCCVIPIQGKDVTVEDGTDSPTEPPVFNPPGHSDPVDQGLPSSTSSLRVSARSYASYSRLQLHVNGATSSSYLVTLDLSTLTGLDMGRRLNALAVTALSFCRWWPWSSDEHRTNGVIRPGVTSSPLNLSLTI